MLGSEGEGKGREKKFAVVVVVFFFNLTAIVAFAEFV